MKRRYLVQGNPACATRNSNVAVPTAWSQLMDHFFDSPLLEPRQEGTNLPLAMWQDEQAFYLEVDVPGIAQDSLSIEVHQRVLKLTVTRPEVKHVDGYDTRRYGTIEQRIALPQSLDESNVEAKLSNGVLNVRIAKVEEAKPRKIDVVVQ